jgi:hypothetical protein
MLKFLFGAKMFCFNKLLIFFFVSKIAAQFDLQFLGDSISVEKEAERNFCETKLCLLDSHDLIYSATQNASVKPCDDFKEFALGTFIKYRANNDRYPYVGFTADVEKAHAEKKRKVLTAKVNDKDMRITKMMKKFFANCVSSDFVRKNGVREMREYLKSIGLSFYPETDQSAVNITKLFEDEPNKALNVFLRHYLTRTTFMNKEVLALKSWIFFEPELSFGAYQDMFYEMFEIYRNKSSDKFKAEFKDIGERSLKFYTLQVNLFNTWGKKNLKPIFLIKQAALRGSKTNRTMFAIKDLKRLTPNLKIDWLKVINELLLSESKLTENDEILVEVPMKIKRLDKFMTTVDKK